MFRWFTKRPAKSLAPPSPGDPPRNVYYALLVKDYTAAQQLAFRDLRHATRKDTEHLLLTQTSWADHADPASVPYFQAVCDAILERFPNDKVLQHNALSDLAAAQGANAEGIAAAQRVYAFWDRVGEPLDSVDPWPKQEYAANVARRRLAALYEKAGRAEDSARLFQKQLCRHLKPLGDYLASRGVPGAFTITDQEGLILHVEEVLDIEALHQKLSLDRLVELLDYFDPKAAYTDLGFRCPSHRTCVMGTHYEQLNAADPRRLKQFRFR